MPTSLRCRWRTLSSPKASRPVGYRRTGSCPLPAPSRPSCTQQRTHPGLCSFKFSFLSPERNGQARRSLSLREARGSCAKGNLPHGHGRGIWAYRLGLPEIGRGNLKPSNERVYAGLDPRVGQTGGTSRTERSVQTARIPSQSMGMCSSSAKRERSRAAGRHAPVCRNVVKSYGTDRRL
jgi:hypothetical protein